jgi:valyl-tRNA synthetase
LSRVQPLELLDPGSPAPERASSRVAGLGECYLERPTEGPADVEALRREREKIAALLEKTRARLADDGFRARAPAEVVRETEEKARELAERIGRIDEHMKSEASPSSPP